MKKLLIAFLLLPLLSFAQDYTNWPAHVAPIATPFSAYVTLTATDAPSFLALIGGSTNSGGGSATNVITGGVLSGNVTNAVFSATGTNAINLQVTNLAIANMNGFGTNSTLVNSKSIGVTNINMLGNNGVINFPNGDSIQEYIGGFAPNDFTGMAIGKNNGPPLYEYFCYVIGGASNDVAATALKPITGANIFGGIGNITTGNYSTMVGGLGNFIGYNTNSIILGGYNNAIEDGGRDNLILGGYNSIISDSSSNVTILGNSVTIGYASKGVFVWNDGANGNQIVGATNRFIIYSANGVSIGTNSSGTNALEVVGNIDSTVGFSVNGLPINSSGSSPGGSGSISSQFFVTNGFGTAANFNGIYTAAGTGYYTNSFGYYLIMPNTWIPTNTGSRFSISGYALSTTISVPFSLINPSYTSSYLLGQYVQGTSDSPTNTLPYVSYYNPFVSSGGTTYGNDSGGAGVINGLNIGTNLSPAQLAAAGVVTNGYVNKTGVLGTTNPFYAFNTYEFPAVEGQYKWSTDYSAYTNSANTNYQFWLSGTIGAWVFATNKVGVEASTINPIYIYFGNLNANGFPTDPRGLWALGDQVTLAIGVDMANFITSTNYLISTVGGQLRVIALSNYDSVNNVTLESMVGTNGTALPLVSTGKEGTTSDKDFIGRLTLWSWGTNSTTTMINNGRIFGLMGDWAGDARSYILKGMGNPRNQSGGGAFILETAAAAGSPGTHGTFNNPLYVATNGMMAIGNLTDVSDNNQNTLKPPFWLTVYGDGSAWSGGSSTVPSFGIMSKSLVSAPVAAAEENDGNYRYWTDGTASRHKYMVEGVNANADALTNIPASQLTGTVPLANMNTNVALINGTNVFTGTNSWTKPLQISTPFNTTILNVANGYGYIEVSGTRQAVINSSEWTIKNGMWYGWSATLGAGNNTYLTRISDGVVGVCSSFTSIPIADGTFVAGKYIFSNSIASYAPHIPVAVTVGASPFTFTNNGSGAIECYFSGATAYSVSKNGVGVFGSLAGDSYFVLQPTNQCAITYTVAPTFYTNSW